MSGDNQYKSSLLGQKKQRTALWQELANSQWDVIVIGGGITGAGVLHHAASLGLKALLVEQQDFAWGTSSRSSKMVHGGLRYLSQGEFALTREAVKERQKLLKDLPGLVEPLKYIYPFRKGEFPGKIIFNLLLMIYDALAARADYKYFKKNQIMRFFPGIYAANLTGGTQFTDAATDDTRLVFRVLYEAIDSGATAINYVKASQLITKNNKVVGVCLTEQKSQEQLKVYAKAVINATGAWADILRSEVSSERRIRPLRGSHIIVPSWRLPVYQAITGRHIEDKRAHFIYPWEGKVVIGTTDLDHEHNLDEEARISKQEMDYLLAAANVQFPTVKLSASDIISSFSGVRPIVANAKDDVTKISPSKAKRDHVIFKDSGLLTVTGGKLTTFRVIAQDVFKNLATELAIDVAAIKNNCKFAHNLPQIDNDRLLQSQKRRLQGIFGSRANRVLEYAKAGEDECIPGTFSLWAELRYAAAHEAVEHLDDLLLRRTRVGLLLNNGGEQQMPKIAQIAQQELHWSENKWQRELERYYAIWRSHYSLPTA